MPARLHQIMGIFVVCRVRFVISREGNYICTLDPKTAATRPGKASRTSKTSRALVDVVAVDGWFCGHVESFRLRVGSMGLADKDSCFGFLSLWTGGRTQPEGFWKFRHGCNVSVDTRYLPNVS